jgi:hypothetical protein
MSISCSKRQKRNILATLAVNRGRPKRGAYSINGFFVIQTLEARMEKFVWLNAQVPRDFAIEARVAAAREDISKSELVRRAVAEYMKKTQGGNDNKQTWSLNRQDSTRIRHMRGK